MKSLCEYSVDLWKHHCHCCCWQYGRRSRENRPVRRLPCCHFNHVQLKWTKLEIQLYDPMDCSLPGFSVHGILQARILEWLAMPSSRGSSWHRYQTHVSCVSYTASRFLTTELLGKPLESYGRSQKKMAPNSSQFGTHISLQSGLAAPKKATSPSPWLWAVFVTTLSNSGRSKVGILSLPLRRPCSFLLLSWLY